MELNSNNPILRQLKFEGTRIGWSSQNVSSALGKKMTISPTEWLQLVDSDKPEVGSIGVIPKYSPAFQENNRYYQTGYIGFVTDVNMYGEIRLYDGTNDGVSCVKTNILGYISPRKIREMFPITVAFELERPKPKKDPGFYESIWNDYRDRKGLTDPEYIKRAGSVIGDAAYYVEWVTHKNLENKPLTTKGETKKESASLKNG